MLFESALLSNDEQKNSQKITSSNENEQSEDAYIVFNWSSLNGGLDLQYRSSDRQIKKLQSPKL